jgi:hypothetical protein
LGWGVGAWDDGLSTHNVDNVARRESDVAWLDHPRPSRKQRRVHEHHSRHVHGDDLGSCKQQVAPNTKKGKVRCEQRVNDAARHKDRGNSWRPPPSTATITMATTRCTDKHIHALICGARTMCTGLQVIICHSSQGHLCAGVCVRGCVRASACVCVRPHRQTHLPTSHATLHHTTVQRSQSANAPLVDAS